MRKGTVIKMKKLIAAACAVLCLCFAGTTALAQGEPRNNYTIEEANLSLLSIMISMLMSFLTTWKAAISILMRLTVILPVN